MRKEELHSIYSALYRMDELYNVEMPQERFESLAMEAYRKIGNKRTKQLIFLTTIEDYRITLPSGIVDILGITDNVGAYENLDQNGDHPLFDHPGEYLDYKIDGGEIILPIDNSRVCVLYTVEHSDEEGFPLITEKESEAISNYCLAIHFFKKSIETKDQSMLTAHQKFQQDWLLTVDQARVPEHISDDTMNRLGDINTSRDRKVYKRSFKYIK